jgi:hypothetical protein
MIVRRRALHGYGCGPAIAVKSNPDGYTLVLGTTSTLAINQSLYPRLGYDIARCSPDTALRDITQLIELGLLKRSPGGGRSTGYELAGPQGD